MGATRIAGWRLGAWGAAAVVLGAAALAWAQPAEYTVQPGDTLYSIARRFGTSPQRLAQLNRLQDPNRLQPGQRLKLEAGGHVARTPQAGGYVVQPGDTLWSVAQRYGTTPHELARANGMRLEDALKIGQVLTIPPAESLLPVRRTAGVPSRGLALVSFARRFLGVPYRWGGTGLGGFDCSGFLYAVFRQLGVELPRTSFEMFRAGRPVQRDQLQPGDLVFFTTYAPGASHAGMYVGGARFIHASSVGGGVRIDSLDDPYYRPRYLGARRYF
ncbi:MAG: peptidoglycan endopeptidase [candidate division GAL15 bacterium]